MKFCILICARGGSRGIPKKNLQTIGPWSLLEWTIRFALLLRERSDIFVSSDDDVILSISATFGVHALRRPQHLATDKSPEDETWKHMIPVMTSHGSYQLCVVLPCTSPFRSIRYFCNLESFFRSGSFFLASASEARRNPWFNMATPLQQSSSLYQIVNSGSDSKAPSRRQDAPPVFDLATTFFAFEIVSFSNCISRYHMPFSISCVSSLDSLDIDSPHDLEMARASYKYFIIGNANLPFDDALVETYSRLIKLIEDDLLIADSFRICKCPVEAMIISYFCGLQLPLYCFSPNFIFADLVRRSLINISSTSVVDILFSGHYRNQLRPTISS